SVRTIRRRRKELNLSVNQCFTDISEDELQRIVADFRATTPNSGYRMVSGYLRSIGISKESEQLSDPLIQLEVSYEALRLIPRRPYSVPSPLSLWHIDGNHKLVRWRIIVHGGIDGYSRKIMYLQANTNNKSSMVLQCFLEIVQSHGSPVRVRSDKGGENVDVARFMLEHPLRGPGISPYFNISLFFNLQSNFLNYYAAFHHLEDSGFLDPNNDLHILCLQFVMIPRINAHRNIFKSTWDRHPLSSEGHKSPQQLWISGQISKTETLCDQVEQALISCIDEESMVSVPEPPSFLLVVLTKLQDSIDPFMHSNTFGMKVYKEAVRVASACILD
uniref:Integrase catalytic domain-containing protein n=1 Tax=Sinocyclocheilus rhinocerous TaxID=307959 RepID=A0A673LYY8_9TELE